MCSTADRPHTLRGTDANQTIDQSHLYGSFVRESLDAGEPSVGDLRGVRVLACGAVAATGGVDPGPVHVNFPLDKPLEPVELSAEQAASLRSADPVGVDGHADGAPIVAGCGAVGGCPNRGRGARGYGRDYRRFLRLQGPVAHAG